MHLELPQSTEKKDLFPQRGYFQELRGSERATPGIDDSQNPSKRSVTMVSANRPEVSSMARFSRSKNAVSASSRG